MLKNWRFFEDNDIYYNKILDLLMWWMIVFIYEVYFINNGLIKLKKYFKIERINRLKNREGNVF